MALVTSFCRYCKGILSDKENDFHATCLEAIEEFRREKREEHEFKLYEALTCSGCYGLYCDQECFNIEHVFIPFPEHHNSRKIPNDDVRRMLFTENYFSCRCCKKILI